MTVVRQKERPGVQPVVKDNRPRLGRAPFEMANLYPRTTGLPMTVWVSPRGRTRHDARVKVCRTHGDNMDPSDLAVVAIRPEPRIVHGPLTQNDFALVAAWIALNNEALVDYWNGTIDTLDLGARLRRADAPSSE